MLTQDQLPIGSVVSFDLWPAQIIGATIKNARVLAIVDGETARLWGDARAMHAAVFPTLPAGVPNRFDGYNYVRLQLQSNEKIVIGLPWIKDASLQLATVGRVQVILEGVSQTDYVRLTKALSSNGFNIGSIDWVN